MIRGFYSAASGALTQQKNINVISNNIANSTTTGFKSQTTITSSFYDHVVSRISEQNEGQRRQEIGPGTFMTVALDEYTNFKQGIIQETGISTNMAVNGQGFFMIENEKYGEILTRNGAFSLDDEGYLKLEGMGKVLNDGGQPISIEGSNFSITEKGEILDSEGETLDKVGIALPGEGEKLTKIGEDCFYNENGYSQAEEGTYQVVGAALEKSNTSIADELTKLMAGQRTFQSCTQVVKMYDKLNEQTVQIGKIG